MRDRAFCEYEEPVEQPERSKSDVQCLVINRPPLLPKPLELVLVEGGVGYYNDNTGQWHTKMDWGNPVIQWEVKWWSRLPIGL